MRRWIVALVAGLFAFSAGTLLLAKGPGAKKGPGGSPSDARGKTTSVGVVISTSSKGTPGPASTPAGWSQGKKTGWGGGAEPPGLAKKSGGSSVVVHANATTRRASPKQGKSTNLSASVATGKSGKASRRPAGARGKP